MNIISKIQDINRKVAFLEKKKNKKLKNNANELAFESEKKGNLIILRKSNDLKRAAIENKCDLVELKTTTTRTLMELKERL